MGITDAHAIVVSGEGVLKLTGSLTLDVFDTKSKKIGVRHCRTPEVIMLPTNPGNP